MPTSRCDCGFAWCRTIMYCALFSRMVLSTLMTTVSRDGLVFVCSSSSGGSSVASMGSDGEVRADARTDCPPAPAPVALSSTSSGTLPRFAIVLVYSGLLDHGQPTAYGRPHNVRRVADTRGRRTGPCTPARREA